MMKIQISPSLRFFVVSAMFLLTNFSDARAMRQLTAKMASDTLVKPALNPQKFQYHWNSVSNLALTFGVGSFAATAFGLISLGDYSRNSSPLSLTVGFILGIGALLTGIGGSWNYLKDAKQNGISDKQINKVKRKFGFSLFLSILVMAISSIIVIALSNF